MPGQLPVPGARRRNPPRIPTRSLPPAGFAGPYPRYPKGARPLGDAGRAWWHWAWRTPEAAAWDAGSHMAIARRASLEDDDAALLEVEGIDVSGALALLGEGEEAKAVKDIKWVANCLARLVGGRLAIAQKMLDLDRQLGLTTKSFYDLHFEIVATKEPERQTAPADGSNVRPMRPRAVDPAAVGASS